MIKKVCQRFVILVFAVSISCSTQAQQFFTTKEKSLIGPDGKPFQMKGTNLGNWLVPEGYMFLFKSASSPRLINQALTELLGAGYVHSFWKKFLDNYITRDDIQYLKSIGMNSIRIPFNYRLFMNESYMGVSDSMHGFKRLDQVIAWCKQEKLYVLLDMHCAPGGQTGDNIDDGDGYPFLFEDSTSRSLCISIWQRIAKHYKKESIIIGYDLLNEPIAHYFDKVAFNPLLEPFYKQLTIAIRKVDANHLLFLGGAQWDSNFQPFGSPFDPGLVYTFHKYWTPPTKAVIQDYIDFGNKYKVPIYCGETGENTDGWVDTFRRMLDSNLIGWHFWPYKKPESTRGIVHFSKPPGYDSLINYANSLRASFEDVRKNRPKNIELIKAALDAFIENSKFKNCVENTGYIKALGFRPRDAAVGKQLYNAPFGIQTYTFRRSISIDPAAVLDTIKMMGFTEVESGSAGLSPQAFRKLCDDRGISIPSTGGNFDQLENKLDSIIYTAGVLGSRFVMCSWIPHQGDFKLADAQKAATLFNKAGKRLKEAGLTFCYHAHGYEFQPYGSGTLLDYLMENTNPEFVSFEMDIFWIQFGGGDPAGLLKKYGNRWKLMHLKDMRTGIKKDLSGGTSTENDVALGTGELNIPEILKEARKAGIAHYFIEDESNNISIQVPQSVAYLKSLKE